MDWRPIEEAPKDGTAAYVKRVYGGRVVKEGWAVFDFPAANAPMLQPLAPDPLGRVHPEIMAAEIDSRVRAAKARRWLNPDRIYAFPEPTHWLPSTVQMASKTRGPA